MQIILHGAKSIVLCILKVEVKSISNVFNTTPLRDFLNREGADNKTRSNLH